MIVRNNFLPIDEALALQYEILSLPSDRWDRYANPFERKWTLKDKNLKIFEKLTSDEFMRDMESEFDCRLIRDETKLYWGVHIFEDGDYLDMHLDASVHPVQKLRKHLTVGLYLSKDWKPENGGNLEFSDGTTVAPFFNTLVAFECTPDTWHGSPKPTVCKNNEKRIFVTVSFLSDQTPDTLREKALFRTENNYVKKVLAARRADSSMYKDMYQWDRKVVVTISGIRPDFIRMSEIFKKFDENFFHILIHTGQHYDPLLSDVFFDERKPDFVLETGKKSSNHYEQLAYLSTAIPALFWKEGINPDLVVFLGDSNTVAVALPLKKEGYRICHIEAGMRSGDRRMLEEINRTVCDHCSDIHFVYHEDYKANLSRENITDNVHVVGNTIVEVALKIKFDEPKRRDFIIVDIHRPENFNDELRLRKIIQFANECAERYGVPVKLLFFRRLADSLERFGIKADTVSLMPYREYLETVYHSMFMISDSGTGQEEPALFGTRVIVPRDYTERPQSFVANCSRQLTLEPYNAEDVHAWLAAEHPIETAWLGEGDTSSLITQRLLELH